MTSIIGINFFDVIEIFEGSQEAKRARSQESYSKKEGSSQEARSQEARSQE